MSTQKEVPSDAALGAAFSLPTVISSSVILNAIVRGTEIAVEELGDEYSTVVHKDVFRNSLFVYRKSAAAPADRLSTDQGVVAAQPSLWNYELDRGIKDDSGGVFSSELPVRYFFLTEADALSYIDAIESKVKSLVLTAAAKHTEEEEQD